MNTTTNTLGPTQTNNNEISDCKCTPCHCRPTAAGRRMGGWMILIVVVTWIMGAVLAKGWLKLLAYVFPPYAWYLIVERAMTILLGPAWLQ